MCSYWIESATFKRHTFFCKIGGYADISRLHAWNLDFVENLPAGNRYREMSSKVNQDYISAYRLISLDSVAAPSYP